MKQTTKILKILIGVIFIFSGIVKAIDPVGTQIKFEDYFIAMGLHFMQPTALLLSFLLNAAEFTLGILLVLNVFPKITIWLSLLMMAVFTPLTFWLALYNPVTDCGCFGDAIKLTNWETFFKNVVIVVIILVVMFFDEYKMSMHRKIAWSAIAVTILAVMGFQLYNYRHLPVVDFRPFKIGANIKEKTVIPPNAPKDEYDTKIVYKNNKTGKKKEFSIDSIPYDDPDTWTFDTTINVLVKEGYKPPIHDFILTTQNGEDCTNEILNYNGYTLIFISFELDKADPDALKEIAGMSDFADQNSMKFYIFTASTLEAISKFNDTHKFKGTLCTGDKTMLKTMVRSNPALMLLKDAQVIDKWHFNDFPNNEELKKLIK